MPDNPFFVPVPSLAQSIMGFERAKKLEEERQDVAFNKKLKQEELGLRKQKLDQDRLNVWSTVDLPGVGPVQKNLKSGEIKGLPLSFEQKKELKAAGKTDVTVNNSPEGAADMEGVMNLAASKKLGDKYAEVIANWQTQGAKADQMISDLNLMDQLVEGANTNSIAGMRKVFQGWAQAAGFKVGDILNSSLSDAEALQSIVNRVAPSFRVVGSGSTSDKEFAGLLQSFPQLTTSIQGNKLIISILKGKAARDKQIVDIANDLNTLDPNTGKLITVSEVMRRINKLPPMFSPEMARTARILANNKLSINPSGGPDGGTDTMINYKKGTIKKWNPKEKMWKIIRTKADLKL